MPSQVADLAGGVAHDEVIERGRSWILARELSEFIN